MRKTGRVNSNSIYINMMKMNLLCKSVDGFLYEGNTGTQWVKFGTKGTRKVSCLYH